MFFFLLFLSITALSQLVHEHSKPVPSFRIIHGRVAGLHSHPYQVGIYVTGKIQSQFCGGSLVSNNYVLTAAHCVEDVNALSMELIFGAHNVTDKSEETQVRRISTEFTVHPGWDWSLKQGDVALVKLPEPVNETEHIKIIRLHSGNETFAEEKGTLAGWGITSNTQTQ
ncbi:unnamed protein product [Acanthoscelides obtectus]|uniref:Peptidase S1 domain-containing protein n=1 Tax=Acanthoscelides obtectus TaxID=200917 RepID=A0A9P0QC86_ACAOB|nr:unnamed protein product [Acanthoscelides obtectus]CAK1660822.1 hypothetical protein AOBTE_LOCUS22280 [Acanthoscelides obtectus]